MAGLTERAVARARTLGHRALDRVWLAEVRAAGVEIGAGVRMEGRPNIQRIAGRIVLEAGCVLRSRDSQYHGHILPARLLVDHRDAIIRIGQRTRINGASIHAQGSVTIGADTLIAAFVQIADCDGHVLDPADRIAGMRDAAQPVVIGDRVWIGAGATILKGVTIGDECVVGAGSVVTKDLPPRTLCAGVPARVIRSL